MERLSYINTFLSINLPDKIVISQCSEPIFKVGIKLNDSFIYQTTLEAVDNTGYFYDLNVIVHEYMKAHGITFSNLEFVAFFEGGTYSAETKVVYSTIASGEEFDDDFLYKSYLTTRSFYTIPRGLSQYVAFFCQEDEQAPYGYMLLTVRYADGSVHSVFLEHILYDFHSARVYSFTINSSTIEASLRQAFPDEQMTLLGGAVIHGDRHLQFYIVDERPQIYFFFRNAFNVMEHMYIFGTQTLKFDTSMKEAVVNGRLVPYNRQSERKYQVETIPLSTEEALWFNQFLESPRVMYLINEDYDDDVLISDVSSDISDSAKEQTIIKFSYRLSCQHDWHVSPYIQQIFNNNFNEPFQ